MGEKEFWFLNFRIVIQKVQKKSFYLSDELAEHIGIGFGYSYGFEYIGYKRVKING